VNVQCLPFVQIRRADLECSHGATRMCILVNGKTIKCGATAASASGVSAITPCIDDQLEHLCAFLLVECSYDLHAFY